MEPSTLLENPLRTIRLSNKFSLDRMAQYAHVSRQLIIRAEQAVYASPPPALLKACLELAVGDLEDEGTVYHLYKAFQSQTRKKHYGHLIVDPGWEHLRAGIHPWIWWRKASGIEARIGPAKFYCVHPALLHKLEVTPNLCQTIPTELLVALIDSGYSKNTLDGFEKAYRDFKQMRRVV